MSGALPLPAGRIRDVGGAVVVEHELERLRRGHVTRHVKGVTKADH